MKKTIKEKDLRQLIRESIRVNGGRVDEGFLSDMWGKLKGAFTKGDDKAIAGATKSTPEDLEKELMTVMTKLMAEYMDEFDVDSEEEWNEMKPKAIEKVMNMTKDIRKGWK